MQSHFRGILSLLFVLTVVVLGGLADNAANNNAVNNNAANNADQQRIVFQPDPLAAYQVALRDKKMLVVYFHAEWCEHCRKMKDEVLASDELAPFVDQAVFTMLDIDKLTPDQKGFHDQLKIESYPVMVGLRAEPNKLTEVSRITGYFEPKEYAAHLRTLLGLEDAKEPAPPLETGPALADTANACPPGDTVCQELAKQLREHIVKSKEKAAKEALAKEEAAPAGALMYLALGAELQKISTSVTILKDPPAYTVEVEREGWKYPIRVALSPNAKVVWFTASLSGAVPESQLPTTVIAKLMRKNPQLGAARFSIAENGALVIQTFLYNKELTAAELQFSIDELIAMIRREQALWQEYATAAMPPA